MTEEPSLPGQEGHSPTGPASAAAGSASPFATATVGAGLPVVGQTSKRALDAAQAFLATLDGLQKSAAVLERTQGNLSNWSNLPEQAYRRSGVRMANLSPDQQRAALGILSVVLSPEGFTQVSQVTTADGVLATQSGGGDRGPGFGADHYWISFVGAPSATAPWTIQYGGHHLGVNVTLVGSKMTMAPTLWGSQPSRYTENGSTIEPLAGQTEKAFAVLNSLNDEQRQAAILSSSSRDLVLGAGQDGKTLNAAGINASSFGADQKHALLTLIDEWLRPLNAETTATRLAAAESELNNTLFAWSGPTALGAAIYYRVHSPSTVFEFAHQRGSTAHIHSIYREIGNDYGAKLTA